VKKFTSNTVENDTQLESERHHVDTALISHATKTAPVAPLWAATCQRGRVTILLYLRKSAVDFKEKTPTPMSFAPLAGFTL
jgi:hypothetical protein